MRRWRLCRLSNSCNTMNQSEWIILWIMIWSTWLIMTVVKPQISNQSNTSSKENGRGIMIWFGLWQKFWSFIQKLSVNNSPLLKEQRPDKYHTINVDRAPDWSQARVFHYSIPWPCNEILKPLYLKEEEKQSHCKICDLVHQDVYYSWRWNEAWEWIHHIHHEGRE